MPFNFVIDLDSLNPQQREAVTTLKGPVMILAGAGTGKTRVITSRVAYLIECAVPPEHILAVTFTNKAAREMQERVTKLIPKRASGEKGKKAPKPTISTFHSLCVRILRLYIDRLGYKNNFVIYDESDQVSTLRKIMSHILTGDEKFDVKVVQSLLSKFKNNGPESLRDQPASLVAFAQHVQKQYESALRACNAVDFDDLILLVLKLFEEHPEVLEACRNRYQYIMVDEYQDTNSSQFQLINFLAAKHHNLCVVGDDDQSIYGWRGAQISNLLDMERFYPEVKVIKLEQNYRSTNNILNAANKVIKNNSRRRGKKLWSDFGDGEKIQLSTYESDEAEAEGVVELIELARMTRNVPWEKQAILFRTNQQSRPIETALRKKRVKYNLIGGQSFFDRGEIKDFLAYLKTLVNPDDDVSLLRIANTPPRGLSDVAMERLLGISHRERKSVFGVMADAKLHEDFISRTRNSIAEFHELILSTRNELTACPVAFPLNDWLDEFLEEQGFYGFIKRTQKTAEAADQRIANIHSLLETLGSHTLTHSPMEALQEFLEEITLDSEFAEEKKVEGALTLITMHSCKGLEFPYVHIVGLEDGLLPHSRSINEGTLDEERRLFYVALTRAREYLSLSHCTGRKRYGQVMPCNPSRFLLELPSELLERADAAMKAPPTKAAAEDFFANIFSQIKK